MKNVCAVVPIYNEKAEVAKSVITHMLNSSEFDFIVCDDGSKNSDEVLEAINELVTEFPNRVTLIRNEVNQGQGYTLKKMVNHGVTLGYENFVTLDADGQHRIEDAIGMVEKLLNSKVNVVIGSRFMSEEARKNVPLKRRVLLLIANTFFRLFGIRSSDITSGLRVFDKTIAIEVFSKITMPRAAHGVEIIDRISTGRYSLIDFPCIINYSEYSLQKGLQNSDSIKVLTDFLKYKLLQWRK